MALFDDFPTIEYNGFVIKDISKRVTIPEIIKNNALAFKTYIVRERERIEDVAFKAYGDPNLHWLIMLMNDIVDPFYDWPLGNSELEEYVINKYTDGLYGAHHYELDGKIVPPSTVGGTKVTNLEYETKLNEEKRKIKLLRPEHVAIVVDQEQTILK